MPADAESDLQLEIGHVLFVDLVSYSKLLINEQRQQLRIAAGRTATTYLAPGWRALRFNKA